MAKTKNETPKPIKPYIFHGVDLQWDKGDEEAKGDCPWCDAGEKFTVNVETGMARCWNCEEGTKKGGMNVYGFLRLLHQKSLESTEVDDRRELAKSRLVSSSTLKMWKVAKSCIDDYWLVPGCNQEGKLCQLYRYSNTKTKKLLLPTSGLNQQLFGMPQHDKKRSIVYLCEGPWDAMALWQVLGKVRDTSSGLRITANRAKSLQSQCSVLAVPGCKIFNEQWASLFAGKEVRICFDNDHPKKNPKTGKLVPSAGLSGVERVTGILWGSRTPPKSIKYLRWGPRGYTKKLASGFDIRDLLTTASNRGGSGSLTALGDLLGRIGAVPEEWLREAETTRLKGSGGKASPTKMEYLECTNYQELTNAWREALRWTDGLDRALSVMLACITSTQSVGDQLWVKIISPASGGKSTLCEALSVNTDYVLAKSTLRGFHSGYQTDAEGKEDHSLVSQVSGKTLVTKDGDTLLQAPNLAQILAEARDVYDTVSRTSYRNKASKDYTGIRMTWLLCGTSSLRSIDQSELGERFLDCVIMEDIDLDLEDEILWRKANGASRQVKLEADGQMETHQEPEMTKAMKLTGGYVQHLRDNSTKLLGEVETGNKALKKCIVYGKFIAYSRARPSERQEESSERELAARLVSQMVRLATCLAVVLNRTSLDAEVMRRVKQVALDTSRGQTLEMMKLLSEEPEKGLEVSNISSKLVRKPNEVLRMLRFLRQIGAVTLFQPTVGGVKKRNRWKLLPCFHEIYTEVMG